ncbi:P-loop containing nucleoside triphosphate hydrolase protein [Suillus spraguei]|nr:P-loop containing nucleoside triphosphate hydrolase protein [Suillus spraguei]
MGTRNIPWDAVVTLTRLATMGISLLSELSVLFTILREQQDGLLLAILGFSRPMFRWYYGARLGLGVFASSLLHTTTNKDYIRMEGLKHLVTESRYRKELVASNIDEYITSHCFYPARSTKTNDDTPFLVLALVEHASTSYMSTYFPEREWFYWNISFQYPLRERYALQDVSFKIEAGQLCVIVGANGSGKSTILNLIFRIYDPTEGSILIDNRDIKTLRLADLRAAMSVLFQDYTHFPLTISENIGLGNPVLAHDSDKIREAARLGSAEEFIDDLPDGFDTYVDCPAANYYAKDPEMPFEMSHRVLRTERISATLGFGASGGEMQRLAVSRTFMRSLPTETESSAGMLLFDEPSASLDPTAEYDLFERLRKLKGDKTMIFSTHRYGNLTRHADIILYMDESVKEQGTHDELMKQGGEYARNWNLQAKPFL